MNILKVLGILYFAQISQVTQHVLLMCLQEYRVLFDGSGNNPGEKTLEDRFFEHEVSYIFQKNISHRVNVIIYHQLVFVVNGRRISINFVFEFNTL